MGALRKIVVITIPALVAGCLLVALAAEAWVRTAWDPHKGVPGFFLSDPVLGQRLATNYDGWFAGVPVHINSLGLRDPREYDLKKSPRTFRILVLGDSVTFGHGSVYEHTYPYLLEQRLKAWRADIDWQIWNASVPGYNTSQELAQLREVGPRFGPDLVVVGFFENDLTDNRDVPPPGALKKAAFALLSQARRHVYSLELYKRMVLALAWKLSASDDYRRRLEHLGTEEQLLATSGDAAALREQQLTEFERLSDQQVRDVSCYYGMKADPAIVTSIQHDPGYGSWVDAVRGFQQLNRSGKYRVLFFLNVVPPICPDGDVFYDGGTRAIDDLYLRVTSDGTPAVSCYEAFLHVRPSQMPNARAHAIGNSNVVKADVLFGELSNRVLPPLLAALSAR